MREGLKLPDRAGRHCLCWTCSGRGEHFLIEGVSEVFKRNESRGVWAEGCWACASPEQQQRGWHCLGGSREGLEGECQAWGAFCLSQILLFKLFFWAQGGGNWIPSLAPEKNEAAGVGVTGKAGLRQGWDQAELGSHRAGIRQSWNHPELGSGRLGSPRAGIRQIWDQAGWAHIKLV